MIKIHPFFTNGILHPFKGMKREEKNIVQIFLNNYFNLLDYQITKRKKSILL